MDNLLKIRQLSLPETHGVFADGTPYMVHARDMEFCTECDHHTYMHPKRFGRCWAKIPRRWFGFRQCRCGERFISLKVRKEDE